MPLTLNSRLIGDVVVVRCDGRLVGGPEVESLRQCVHGLDSDLNHVVLDLSSVTFIDSSGLGMLVRLLARLRSRGGDMQLCNVPDIVSKALKLTNLHTLLSMHPSEADAISAFYTKSKRIALPQSSIRVLCVDSSTDLLAYLREVLQRAGYHALAANNVYDALVLLRAAPPKLIVLGPTLVLERAGHTPETFRSAISGVPVVELGVDFSVQDAGDAAQKLIERLRTAEATKTAQH